MNVVCPRCQTTFAFPADMYRLGRKVRCSVCHLVFPLPAEEGKDTGQLGDEHTEAADSVLTKKRSFFKLPNITLSGKVGKARALILGVAVVCFILIGFGSYILYTGIMSPSVIEEGGIQTESASKVSFEAEQLLLQQREKIAHIELQGIRQYIVQNDAINRNIMVIQGVAVNKFNSTKRFITVEGVLTDENNKILTSKIQMGGPELSVLQLRNFTEEQLNRALNDKLAILVSNDNVPPGGQVPFILVFTSIPQKASSFEVRPIDARDPEIEEKNNTSAVGSGGS